MLVVKIGGTMSILHDLDKVDFKVNCPYCGAVNQITVSYTEGSTLARCRCRKEFQVKWEITLAVKHNESKLEWTGEDIIQQSIAEEE